MTIREYVRRRERWLVIARRSMWVWFFVMFVPIMAFWPHLPKYLLLTLLAIYCVPLAMQLYLASTKCPRCGFDLRSKPMTKVWREASKDSCPHCGTSLDEPMVEAPK
jgi:ribosomal protein S27AE